ncbi:hypothetical protein FRB94_010361 [Tulasnella sp. JGI-2019a]|nr:hypothetical protein FRB93_010033 [Tulasnella sp. JGI-2019a]KAG8993803.1 hypothetical protein FRB94_010361 [Tulasnella sp. JGI-2019a]KAG9031053.1 hypothetical protein FRB95_003218 [Tulasnella sp. JGI-2019a]
MTTPPPITNTTDSNVASSSVTSALNLPILEDNPYAGHPELSALEANVLWEYAKMAGIVKQLATTTRNLANAPANDLLSTMRTVESQMGLVLTLFKASVWSTIVTAEAEQGHDSRADASQSSAGGGVRRAYQPPTGREEDVSFYSDDVTPQPRYRQ